MKKTTFLYIVITFFIVLIAFLVLLFIANISLQTLAILLLQAIFTGGIIAIGQQIIILYNDENKLSSKLFYELLYILDWCRSLDINDKSQLSTLRSRGYRYYRNLLKLKNDFIFSRYMQQINRILTILENLLENLDRDPQMISNIVNEDLIPELEKFVEP